LPAQITDHTNHYQKTCYKQQLTPKNFTSWLPAIFNAKKTATPALISGSICPPAENAVYAPVSTLSEEGFTFFRNNFYSY